MENKKPSSNFFVIAYILGALFSLTLAVLATWGDIEAAFYGFDRRASTPLKGLRCPILMNRNETGVVSVRISNTTDRKLSPSVKAEFSTRSTPTSTLDSIPLEPGESRTMEWTIGPENIDLGRFVFAKALVFASYPIPDREATCGTFVIDLPVSGNVLVVLMIIIGAAGLGGGLYLLRRSKPLSNRVEKAIQPLTFLGSVIAITLIVSLMGGWVQALLLLAVTLLTIVVTLGYVFFR